MFNLKEIPFSYKGSYMAVSEIPRDYRGYSVAEGIYLRSVHGGIASPFIGRILPTFDGEAWQKEYEARYEELIFRVREEEIHLCFADMDTLLIYGKGCHAGVTMDFSCGLEGGFDYIYEISKEDRTCYVVNAAKNNRRYVLIAQEGSIEVAQSWDGKSTKNCCARIVPGERGVLVSIHEVEKEWDETVLQYDYATALEKVKRELDAYAQTMPTVPQEYEEVRKLAAYVNWSACVRKNGFLSRDSMFMSKNWMCGIWSWDHCFNAMALSYGRPEDAWNQFMTMFDYQDTTGRIPDMVTDAQEIWNFCKPPVHGWALLHMMKHMELSREQKEEVYEKLLAWTDWWFCYRDHEQEGICEYNHGNDCGWDNSTVFKELPPVKLPELQAFLIIQMDALMQLAKELGKAEEVKKLQMRQQRTLAAMLALCFVDQKPVAIHSKSHEVIPNESLILYEEILLGDRLPKEIRDNLVTVLKGPKFLTDYGYATESPASADYEDDGYWRGPIWAPSTLLLVDGLKRCGETALAKDVARRFCQMVKKSGFAENFCARTGEGLRDRAYTWTSSVFLILAHEYLL